MTTKRLGFFSRLLDDATAGERYRLATEQIVQAERVGFDSAWIAQHHFHAAEGGLPSPFVFLAHVAGRTNRIRLGTGVITLPMENPVRVAEDAAVLDLLSGGRLEVGLGTGATPASFEAFGFPAGQRNEVFARSYRTVIDAWRGDRLGHDENHLYPAAPHLIDRVWQATFSVSGGVRAIRAARPETRDQAQRSFTALFEPAFPGAVSLSERYAVAAFAAGLQRDPAATAFYSARLAAPSPARSLHPG